MRGLERHLAIKAANDTGWEIPVVDDGDWLHCASSRFDAVAWIGTDEQQAYLVCFDEPRLVRTLTREVSPTPHRSAPASPCFQAGDHESLYEFMRRAAQVAGSLPDNPCREFQRQTAGLPKTTEAERVVVQRIGQTLFRDSLIAYWGGTCAVTGLAEPSLLRASHAKPWAQCDNDEERLDVFNGLLLAPHLDALFDGGWIGFEDDGNLRFSKKLTESLAQLLHIDSGMRLHRVEPEHLPYLAFHRNAVMANS